MAVSLALAKSKVFPATLWAREMDEGFLQSMLGAAKTLRRLARDRRLPHYY